MRARPSGRSRLGDIDRGRRRARHGDRHQRPLVDRARRRRHRDARPQLSTFIEQNVTNWTLHRASRVRRAVKVGVAYGSPTRRGEPTLLLQAA
ncbi:MAG: hypothetical protein MZW92_13440 [Comamonadaceae bacterium]|nr:hypothetical protein [Comamonadaceae bacterium]